MKKIISLLFVIIFLQINSYGQKAVNVEFEQEGNNVAIYYDLEGGKKGQNLKVKVFCSMDGGGEWIGPLKGVTGDAGEGVTPGLEKEVVWESSKDVKKLKKNLQFKIEVEVLRLKGLVFVKGGSFLMGSDFGEKDESPVHKVTIKDFYISKYEVTIGDYKKFVDATGYKTAAEKKGSAYIFNGKKWTEKEGVNWRYDVKGNKVNQENMNLPVSYINFYDAFEYCKWIGARLPTEAEWEYAARGGSKSKGYKYAGSNNIDQVAWYLKNSGGNPHKVGTKEPNELGLYDMSGNAWEWCNDYYSASYYSGSPKNESPKGPSIGLYKVLRGGAWFSQAKTNRITDREWQLIDLNLNYFGFRIVQD